ncbi:MAG TPA: signal recognition particle subunit SRP19/SEC65 family protein [Thermoplasmata archaeon]|nr:signal recognition particle subunit SRP19/SEC65 family protein [Thermoplasmata archaeon]
MPDHFYVYPAYLGRGLSRRAGRRLPESEAVADATAEEIAQAAQRLGYRAELESAKQYPRRFFAYEGRVKVTKRAGTTKTTLLRALAAEVRRHRPASAKK